MRFSIREGIRDMTLKERVDRELRRVKRSRSWLAGEMGMTPDGLRLSLIKRSIKYGDIVRVCEILGVRAGVLFGEGEVGSSDSGVLKQVQDDDAHKRDDREMMRLLKAHIKDKDRIIALLSK
jgi:hypothetical protein